MSLGVFLSQIVLGPQRMAKSDPESRRFK